MLQPAVDRFGAPRDRNSSVTYAVPPHGGGDMAAEWSNSRAESWPDARDEPDALPSRESNSAGYPQTDHHPPRLEPTMKYLLKNGVTGLVIRFKLRDSSTGWRKPG